MTESIHETRKRVRLASKSFSIRQLVIVEGLTMFFALTPGIVAWLAVVHYVRYFWAHPWFSLAMLGAPLVLVTSFLAAVGLLRCLIPPMKPGIYRIGLSKGFMAWFLTLCLGHAVRVSGLQPFFFTFYLTKYVYWRIMGAKIAYGVNSSIFANLADYPMIHIGRGSTLGAHVFLSGHTFVGDKVLLGKVVLGENVFLGFHVTVGPKTTIGSGSWIGMYNRLLHDTLPENSRLENFEWEHFSPRNQPKAPEPVETAASEVASVEAA